MFNSLTKNITSTGLISSSDDVNEQPVGVFNFMEETFVPIIGYEGHYEININGDIYRVEKTVPHPISNKLTLVRKKLCSYKRKNGYIGVRLTKNGCSKNFLLHRLIAIHFIPNPNNYNVVNHLNAIRSDNRVENLQWCTTSQNIKHSYFMGAKPNKNGAGKVGSLHSKSKAIKQLSLSGELIRVHESISLAAKEVGSNVSNIIRCMKGKRKSIKGFTWEYLN